MQKFVRDEPARCSHYVRTFRLLNYSEGEPQASLVATKSGLRIGDTEFLIESNDDLNLFLEQIREGYKHVEELRYGQFEI